MLMLAEVLLLSPLLVNFGQGFLLSGRSSNRYMHQWADDTVRLSPRAHIDCKDSSNSGLRELHAAADGDVVLKFKPSEVEVIEESLSTMKLRAVLCTLVDGVCVFSSDLQR